MFHFSLVLFYMITPTLRISISCVVGNFTNFSEIDTKDIYNCIHATITQSNAFPPYVIESRRLSAMGSAVMTS